MNNDNFDYQDLYEPSSYQEPKDTFNGSVQKDSILEEDPVIIFFPAFLLEIILFGRGSSAVLGNIYIFNLCVHVR